MDTSQNKQPNYGKLFLFLCILPIAIGALLIAILASSGDGGGLIAALFIAPLMLLAFIAGCVIGIMWLTSRTLLSKPVPIEPRTALKSQQAASDILSPNITATASEPSEFIIPPINVGNMDTNTETKPNAPYVIKSRADADRGSFSLNPNKLLAAAVFLALLVLIEPFIFTYISRLLSDLEAIKGIIGGIFIISGLVFLVLIPMFLWRRQQLVKDKPLKMVLLHPATVPLLICAILFLAAIVSEIININDQNNKNKLTSIQKTAGEKANFDNGLESERNNIFVPEKSSDWTANYSDIIIEYYNTDRESNLYYLVPSSLQMEMPSGESESFSVKQDDLMNYKSIIKKYKCEPLDYKQRQSDGAIVYSKNCITSKSGIDIHITKSTYSSGILAGKSSCDLYTFSIGNSKITANGQHIIASPQQCNNLIISLVDSLKPIDDNGLKQIIDYRDSKALKNN